MTDNLNTEARLNFFAFGPDAMRAMSALDTRVAQSDLELRLNRTCSPSRLPDQRLRLLRRRACL